MGTHPIFESDFDCLTESQMEVENWPYDCPSCKVSIPNQVTLIAHKNGKKHQLKYSEYERRLEEATRTIFISGAILTQPHEVAPLLIKSYLEDNFGVVEKVVIQGKFAFAIFDHEQTAIDCAKEKSHDVNGSKMLVRRRKTAQKGEKEAKVSVITETRRMLNQCANSQLQMTCLFGHFKSVPDLYQSALEQFRQALMRKFTFGKVKLSIVGSARLDMLKGDESDIDMVLEVVEFERNFLCEGYREKGEKSVRAKKRDGVDSRWERPITEQLFIVAGLIIELGKEHKGMNLGNVHAVPGARKPLVRFAINGQKVELSVGNVAALVNTEWMLMLMRDETFATLARLTRRIFDLNGLTRIGRLNSYAVMCLLAHFLTTQGIVGPLDAAVGKEQAHVAIDDVCTMKWDYRLPNQVPLKWPETTNSTTVQAVDYFAQFIAWLPTIDFAKVVNCRTGHLVDAEQFMATNKLNAATFHQSPLMVADPFELEHNVTGQVSARNLEKMTKILKAFLIRFKMNRFLEFVKSDVKNGDKSKDWGYSLLLLDNEQQTEEAKSSNDKKILLNNGAAFQRYIVDVMRAQLDQPLLADSETRNEPRDAKMGRMDVQEEKPTVSVRATLSGKLDYPLWVGRRKLKRKINEKFKNCSWLDVENQITNELLGSITKLDQPLNFEMEFVSISNEQYEIECRFSNEKLGHDFFRHLTQSAHYFTA